MAKTNNEVFVTIAFRYGQNENVFPIGCFQTREKAINAAHTHGSYRGGKYEHRVYKFLLDKLEDDIGHTTNQLPCIEKKEKSL